MKTERLIFKGKSKCLHDVSDHDCTNPCMQALSIIAKALWDFDDDYRVPVYDFRDKTIGGEAVCSFTENDQPCKCLVQCGQRYKDVAPKVCLYGPEKYMMSATIDAIGDASSYAIVVVGM